MPKSYSLFIVALWCALFCANIYGQENPRDSTRFFSLGLSVGTPHQVAYPADNPSDFFLTNSALLSFETYRFALHSHFIKTNGLGYGLDFGYQKFFMAVRDEPTQAFFNGKYSGEFSYGSFFLTPQVIYNFQQKHGNLFNLHAGTEIHVTTGPAEYTFNSGTFFVDPNSSFVLLRLGLEYQKKLGENFWAGLYLNLTQGVTDIAVLNYAQANSFDVSNLGSYKGTGFEFGVRVSLKARR